MADLGIYLENVLRSIRQDIRPALDDERALGSLTAIEQIIARIIVNSSPSEASEALTLLATPLAHFGGVQCYDDARDAAAAAFTSGGMIAIRDILERESRLTAQVHSTSMALIDAQVATAASPSGSPATASVAASAIESYLRHRAASPAARVVTLKDVFGGRSKATSFLTLSDCPDLPTQLVLRRDASVNLTGGLSVTVEYPLLRALRSHGVPVPQVFLVEADSSVMGAPFMLMERLPGRSGRIYHSPSSIPLLRAVARALAALHTMPIEAIAGSGLPLEPPPRAQLLAQINETERKFAEFDGPRSISTVVGFEWLRRHLDVAAEGRSALVHGDLLFHNILFEGDELRALLDWELARVGYPAADLGYIRPAVDRVMPWADFIAEYVGAGGPVVPDEAVDFHAIWSNLSMTMLSAQVMHYVRQGQITDIGLTAVCMHDVCVWGHDLAQHLLRVARRS